MALWIKPHAGKENETKLQSGEFECWDTPPPDNAGWREAIEVRPAKNDIEQYYGHHYIDLTKTPVEIVWPVESFSPSDIEINTKNALEAMNAPVLRALVEIDNKKIRAISEFLLTGDKTRLEALEAEAVTLRATIKKTL